MAKDPAFAELCGIGGGEHSLNVAVSGLEVDGWEELDSIVRGNHEDDRCSTLQCSGLRVGVEVEG